MIVVDTDVLIDFLGGHNPAADRVALELERGQLTTTAVNRFELLAGVRSTRQDRLVRELLAALTTLPLDQNCADAAARVRRTLEAAGTAIGMGDSLIAGIVLTNSGVLLTRNRRHFDRVEGLALSVLSPIPKTVPPSVRSTR
jgi:tRNA(fMet)-specific endonuclease VapC